jgi:hypothetical protein
MYSVIDILALPRMGFPIQRSSGQYLFSGSPKLIAASHVFHHHPAPRHPPFALSSLAINICHLSCLPVFLGAFEIVFLCIQFSKNNLGLRPELKAQSQKLRKLFYFQLWAFNFENHLGGGERDRTDDLLRAREALSHLSYTP